jgi:hypothetical protein
VLTLEVVEAREIQKAMRVARGSVIRASKLLGIGRATLYRRLAHFDRHGKPTEARSVEYEPLAATEIRTRLCAAISEPLDSPLSTTDLLDVLQGERDRLRGLLELFYEKAPALALDRTDEHRRCAAADRASVCESAARDPRARQ